MDLKIIISPFHSIPKRFLFTTCQTNFFSTILCLVLSLIISTDKFKSTVQISTQYIVTQRIFTLWNARYNIPSCLNTTPATIETCFNTAPYRGFFTSILGYIQENSPCSQHSTSIYKQNHFYTNGFLIASTFILS